MMTMKRFTLVLCSFSLIFVAVSNTRAIQISPTGDLPDPNYSTPTNSGSGPAEAPDSWDHAEDDLLLTAYYGPKQDQFVPADRETPPTQVRPDGEANLGYGAFVVANFNDTDSDTVRDFDEGPKTLAYQWNYQLYNFYRNIDEQKALYYLFVAQNSYEVKRTMRPSRNEVDWIKLRVSLPAKCPPGCYVVIKATNPAIRFWPDATKKKDYSSLFVYTEYLSQIRVPVPVNLESRMEFDLYVESGIVSERIHDQMIIATFVNEANKVSRSDTIAVTTTWVELENARNSAEYGRVARVIGPTYEIGGVGFLVGDRIQAYSDTDAYLGRGFDSSWDVSYGTVTWVDGRLIKVNWEYGNGAVGVGDYVCLGLSKEAKSESYHALWAKNDANLGSLRLTKAPRYGIEFKFRVRPSSIKDVILPNGKSVRFHVSRQIRAIDFLVSELGDVRMGSFEPWPGEGKFAWGVGEVDFANVPCDELANDDVNSSQNGGIGWTPDNDCEDVSHDFLFSEDSPGYIFPMFKWADTRSYQGMDVFEYPVVDLTGLEPPPNHPGDPLPSFFGTRSGPKIPWQMVQSIGADPEKPWESADVGQGPLKFFGMKRLSDRNFVELGHFK